MIDYGAVLKRYGVEPKGVLHLGGYDGGEDLAYCQIGFRDRLFVEAQPDTFARLKQFLDGRGASCEQYAVSNVSHQTVTMHVAQNGQSSSILPMEKHLEIYPHIPIIDKILVETIRVDDLLAMDKYKHNVYNFLNCDIQGAELLALSGSCVSLRNFDILNLEVNFDELYKGLPHITEIDAFLSVFDFVRADTVLAHPTWGDAIYVKNRFTKVSQNAS
jgi:FkbM family methyltransferase